MKTKIILTLMIIMGVTSCKKSVVTPPFDPAEVLIAVKSAKLDAAPATRATSIDGFGLSSQIGIYATATPSTDLTQATDVNVGYSNTSGSTYWNVNPDNKAIYYAENNAGLNFFAYHPYSKQPKSTVVVQEGSSLVDYTLPSVQSDENALLMADLMWGTAFDVRQEHGSAKIEFIHMLTKVTLNIARGTDWGVADAKLSQIKMYGAPILSSARLDLSTGGLVTAAGATNTITCTLAEPLTLNPLNPTKVEFIAIPVADIAGMTMEFTVNGEVYSIVISAANVPDESNRSFRSASNRVFALTISRNGEQQLEVIPSILPWNVVSEIAIEGI